METKKYVLHIPAEDLDFIKKEDKSEVEQAMSKQINNYMRDIADKIDKLDEFADFALGFQHTISENGFAVNKDHDIEIVGDPIFSGAMLGTPVVSNVHDARVGCKADRQYKIPLAGIINTVDDGFHYIGTTKDDDTIHDLGRIDHPCYIGNAKGPHGIYVPLNSCAVAHAATLFDINKSNLKRMIEGDLDIDDCIESISSDDDTDE